MTQHGPTIEVTPSRSPRLVALDAFRGLTIGAMILVNNPGFWSHTYAPLRHAAWHGCTPTDLVFPFFLFIVGVAMAYSVPRHLENGRPGREFWARVTKRVLLLLGLGLLLNAWTPVWKSLAAWDWATAADLLGRVRLPGVLQRIGLVYLLACLAVVFLKPRGQAVLCVLILVICPALMIGWSSADPFGEHTNLARAIDRAVLPPAMLYGGSPTDPEGLLGTATSLVSALIGYWCGLHVRSRPSIRFRDCVAIAAAGIVLVVAGLTASVIVPLNKPLWTSSYVLYTGGWALVVFGVCLTACDFWRVPTRGAWALLGRHAITVFVGSGILARVLVLVPGPSGHPSFKAWITAGFDSLLSPLNASLAFALLTVVTWWIVAWALDRAGIVLKV